MSDYIVKNGDSLFRIAQANGLTLEEVRKENPHLTQGLKRSTDGSRIYPGDHVALPDKEELKCGSTKHYSPGCRYIPPKGGAVIEFGLFSNSTSVGVGVTFIFGDAPAKKSQVLE
jgi:LysM repeat protein